VIYNISFAGKDYPNDEKGCWDVFDHGTNVAGRWAPQDEGSNARGRWGPRTREVTHMV
jgi:hypothetical protein